MNNVPEAMLQIVRLNSGGEMLKDMKRILKNLNKIPWWVVSIQDGTEVLWASSTRSSPGGASEQSNTR